MDLERIAAQMHATWATYMAYFLDRCPELPNGDRIIAAEYVANLRKQIDTPYADLSEGEKDLDRLEAQMFMSELSERSEG